MEITDWRRQVHLADLLDAAGRRHPRFDMRATECAFDDAAIRPMLFTTDRREHAILLGKLTTPTTT